MNQRVQKLRASLAEANLPGMLLLKAEDVGYLSGFSGSTAALLITPERGILPRLFRLHDAQAQFSLASGTWICRGHNSYLSAIIPSFSLPGLNLPGGLSCCRPYQEEK